MAAIYRGPERGYTLDYADVLWLARGLVGEGGENISRTTAAWHAWSWLERLLLDTRFRSWSYGKMVENHSQALSPLWLDPDSAKCKQFPDDCKGTRLARRERMRSLSESQLRGYGVWQLAEEFQAGTLDCPYSEPMYDFAACSLTRKQSRPCAGVEQAGQCFLPYRCLKSGEKATVIPGTVDLEVNPFDIPKKLGGWMWIPVVLAGGYLAWKLWPRRKR